MRSEVEAQHGACGPGVLTTHVGILDTGHQFESVLCDVIVHSEVPCLVQVTTTETRSALVTSLGVEAIVFI